MRRPRRERAGRRAARQHPRRRHWDRLARRHHCLWSHQEPPRRRGGVPLLGAPRKTDPPRALGGGHVVSARRCSDPCVLLVTYGSAGVPPGGSTPAPPLRRRRCSSGSPAARRCGRDRTSSRSDGSVVVEAPPLGASGNSTAAPRLPIISTETTRLHSAGRSGARRVARLALPAAKPPPSRRGAPVSGLLPPQAVAPGPGETVRKWAQRGRWGHSTTAPWLTTGFLSKTE
jgi:hypothetical protein